MTMIFNGLVLISVIIASVSIFIKAEDEIPCQKINFNTADKGNIEKCPSITQQLTKKEYANSRYIKPFRKDAKYYLSNQKSKISCEQTKETFRMDQNSLVQMTNFLYFSQDASLSVKVIDLDDLDEKGNAKVVYEWKLIENTQEWEVFNKTIDKNIARAKVSSCSDSLEIRETKFLKIFLLTGSNGMQFKRFEYICDGAFACH